MHRLSGSLEDLAQIFCGCREALLIVGLAANPGDNHVERGRARLQRARADDRKQQSALHTTPHLRRRSHSAAGSATSSTNTMGIFQSSLVLRTEMPASE